MRGLPKVREEWKEDEEVVKRKCALQRRHREPLVQECVPELPKRPLLRAWVAPDVALKLNDRALLSELKEAVE